MNGASWAVAACWVPATALAAGRRWRRTATGRVAAATVPVLGCTLLVLDLLLPGTPPGGLWLVDRLGRTLLGSALLAWTVTAALLPERNDRASGSANGRWWTGSCAAAGGTAMACLADDLFLAIAGLGVAMLGTQGRSWSDPRRLAVPAFVLASAWLAAILLSHALGAPARWSELPRVAASGGETGLAAALLGSATLGTCWFAVSRAQRPDGWPFASTRAGMVGAAGCCLLLRCLALPDGGRFRAVTTFAAAAMLLVALLSSPGLLERRDRLAGAAFVLLSSCLVAFAAGGPTAVAAGVLGLFASAAAYPAALLAAAGWRRSVFTAVLAGLPPFAPFVALLLVAEQMFAATAIVALLMLAAL
ncbi:MAG: hypothetical protein INR65_05690, partial [Gluconacetobacter diazotrophicus]|nr:hypothetical protein [Gluconacetobacter diazotrophicus]